MIDPIPCAARVAHILSAVLLLGGLFYAWNLSKHNILPAQPDKGFRPAVWILILVQFITGAYNLMLRMPVPKEYHMLFGVKFLLVLHVAAVSILMVKPTTTPEKRARMLQGLAGSGILVIVISAALRAIGNA
jgi:heme A synthase